MRSDASFDRQGEIQRLFEAGYSLHQRNQLGQAAAHYRKVLGLQPRHFDAVHLLGLIALQQGEPERAHELIGAALALDPNSAAALLNLGSALAQLNRDEAAIASLSRAIALDPGFADAYFNRGNAHRRLERYEESAADYTRAIERKPGFVEAYYNRAEVLIALRRYEVAVASYDRVLALRPDHAQAYNNRAAALVEIKRFDEAVASAGRALELDPGNLSARINLGNALFFAQRYEEAIDCYQRALASLAREGRRRGKHPGSADPNLTETLRGIRGTLLASYQRICDWRELPKLRVEIERDLRAGRVSSDPLTVMAFTDSGEVQRSAATLWVSRQCPLEDELGAIPIHAPHERIRVGYFSGDFREHPVATALAQLFEVHERRDFEWTAFSYGPQTQDPMRERLAKSVDRFVDVRNLSDREVARLSRELEIDIAVDLSGHTMGSRPRIFALRAAPVQVSYLGYSGTTGAGYIDYIVGDETVIPAGSERHYRESIIYMPRSYLVSDATRRLSERHFTREELGLPAQGFVYCCFNNSYKITPEVFDLWMRVLRRVEGSVLWLSAGTETAQANLQREARQRGVDAGRVIFAPRMKLMSEHLARHRAADLFLDTVPYNAHTTASDALWAGLPVLTRPGESFASRVAGSLLRVLELDELIVATAQEYEDLAVGLAREPRKLAGMRVGLEERRDRSALYDTPRYARSLERAYRAIHRRHLDRLPAAHLRVLE